MSNRLVRSWELGVGNKAKRTHNQGGQSLIELVIVVAVIVIVVGALVFATISSLRNASFAKNQAQATKLAQEGLERVRTGRDRNKPINHGGALVGVTSWNGDASSNGAIWNYQIEGNCGKINVQPPVKPTYCFFNVANDGILNYLTVADKVPSGAETIPPGAQTLFLRVVVLSDDASFTSQKKITAIVTWTDFAGSHESRLTTVLRRI